MFVLYRPFCFANTPRDERFMCAKPRGKEGRKKNINAVNEYERERVESMDDDFVIRYT